MLAKDALAVMKALKNKHNVNITYFLQNEDRPDFYHAIRDNKDCSCTLKRNLKNFIKKNDLSISKLRNIGNNIIKEEKYLKTLEWDKIIYTFRKRYGLTQKNFAKLLNTDRRNISAWENKARRPCFKICKNIVKLANQRNFNIEYLTKQDKIHIKNKKRFSYKENITKRGFIIKGFLYKNNMTTTKFASLVDSGVSTISEYIYGIKNPSSESWNKILKLIRGYNLPEKELLIIGKNVVKKERFLPDLDNSKLAEFIGILLGDGHISNGGDVLIYGDKIIDNDYHINRVKNLSEDLFQKRTYHDYNGTALKTGFRSIKVTKFLTDKCSLKAGKKINIEIPEFIRQNLKLSHACLRGLFDTDGCIAQRNKRNIRIEFGSFKSFVLSKSIENLLLKLGFHTYFYTDKRRNKYAISINNDSDCLRFFNEIGSSNPAKILKFLFWREYKRFPREKYNVLKEKLNINFSKMPFFWNIKYIRKNNKELLPLIKTD